MALVLESNKRILVQGGHSLWPWKMCFQNVALEYCLKNDIIKKDTDLIFTKFEASVNNSSMPAIFS